LKEAGWAGADVRLAPRPEGTTKPNPRFSALRGAAAARRSCARPPFWLALAVSLFCACSGNGHIKQGAYTARLGDDVVNCNCNLTFDHPACAGGTCMEHFAIQLCLPADLQQYGHEAIVVGNPDAGSDPYSMAVDQYCRKTVTNIVYHVIKVFNGGWCDYKAPFSPSGGVGQSVECFAEPVNKLSATTTDDGSCREQCAAVPCDYSTNCGQGVQDSLGNINLDRCQCSVVTEPYGCLGDPKTDLPTAVFCRPPEGTVKR
jgi:hypothetical protein